MAYRRKQPIFPSSSSSSSSSYTTSTSTRASSEDFTNPPSLAAQAIRASSANRDSSLSTAYGESAYKESPTRHRFSHPPQGSTSYEYTSMKSLNESKYGFWGTLARKAKSIMEDDNVAQQSGMPSRTRPQMLDTSIGDQKE